MAASASFGSLKYPIESSLEPSAPDYTHYDFPAMPEHGYGGDLAHIPAKPGKLGIILGPILAALGLATGLTLLLGSLLPLTRALESAPQFSAAQTPVNINMVAGETQGIWVRNWPSFYGCDLTSPAGSTTHIHLDSHLVRIDSFDLMGQFTATTSGPHVLECAAEAGVTIAVAPPISVGGLVGPILGGVGLIVGGILSGLAVLIVSLVRRAQWRQQYGSYRQPSITV